MRAMTALGLSAPRVGDAIRAAIVVTDGQSISVFGPALARPFSAAERATLRAAAIDLDPAGIALADRIVTEAGRQLVAELLETTGIAASEINVVGFDGHTLAHDAGARRHVSAGNAGAIAASLGLPAVGRFREHDLASGGLGIAQAASFHASLAIRGDLALPVGILDLDLVPTLTVVGVGGMIDLVATEVGSCLAAFDDPLWAAPPGDVDAALVDRLLGQAIYDLMPPKSLDVCPWPGGPRSAMELPAGRVRPDLAGLLSPATLAAFIGESVASACDFLVDRPVGLIATGPGAANTYLLASIAERTGSATISAESLDWNAEFIDAQAQAFLAVRHLRELPTSFPGTTAISRPMVGGVDVAG